MKWLRCLPIVLILLVGVSPILAESEGLKHSLAERVEVTAFTNKTSVMIGDLIFYEININVPSHSKIQFTIADQEDQWGGLSLREFDEKGPKRSGNNRDHYTKHFTLESLVPGSYLIPSHKIIVEEPNAESIEVYSQEIFIEVRSSLEDGKELELKGIKPPVQVERNFKWLWILLATLFVIAGLVWLALKVNFANKKTSLKSKLKLPPHLLALEQLQKIKSEDLVNNGKTKEYYYRISSCVRFYIEGRFEIRAPESSTEEFVEEAIQSQKIEGRHINILKEFLSACDLVKFAQIDSDIAQADEIYRIAEAFIQETKPQETVPVEPSKATQ